MTDLITGATRGILLVMSQVAPGRWVPEERRRRACEAALAVAAELGVSAKRAALLADRNNTILRLFPRPIVAKVGTSHFRDARLESLERELAVAAHLRAAGAPVVAPARAADPGPCEASVPVSVVDAVAEELPFAEGSFDAAVASLVLCSVVDVAASLAAASCHAPNGELRFFEHVASLHAVLRALQRAADATAWPHVSGGCHLARETDVLIERAGFTIARCERFAFRIPPLDPPKTHVLGAARRR